MIELGYYAAVGPHSDSEMLDYAVMADKYGIDTIWCGDHFHPFAHEGSRGCGLAWVWMAAAAERTKRSKIGCAVTAPIIKYNPAVVAQAYATLGALYPGRIVMGLGAGEAMNEIPVGCEWPHARERIERLEEAIKIIRLLWNESFVDFEGKYFSLRQANLYTKPEIPIDLCVAADLSPRVAKLAGKYADAFITTASHHDYTHILLPALEEGTREGGRRHDAVKKILGLGVAYDEDYDKAISTSRYWAGGFSSAAFSQPIYDPREIDKLGRNVSDKQIGERLLVCTSAEDFIKPIEEWVKLGFGHVYLSCNSQDHSKFLKMYGEKLLPALRAIYGSDQDA